MAPSLDITASQDDREFSLRWIMVHIIEEYARHNGHADLAVHPAAAPMASSCRRLDQHLGRLTDSLTRLTETGETQRDLGKRPADLRAGH